jgi:hypothetical protein
MMVDVYDRYGVQQPWSWLVEHYGELQIHSFSGAGWKLVRLDENADREFDRLTRKWLKGHMSRMHEVGWPVRKGRVVGEDFANGGSGPAVVDGILAPAVIIAKFLDVDGQPVANLPVCWYWPDAPKQPGCVPANGLEQGILPGRYDGPGMTNGNGDIGFAMGGGAYYRPPAIGPHAIWPCVGENADSARGFGMLGGTNHFSVWPTFQWVQGEPEPPGCRWPEINAILDLTEGRLANIQSDIDAIRALQEGANT